MFSKLHFISSSKQSESIIHLSDSPSIRTLSSPETDKSPDVFNSRDFSTLSQELLENSVSHSDISKPLSQSSISSTGLSPGKPSKIITTEIVINKFLELLSNSKDSSTINATGICSLLNLLQDANEARISQGQKVVERNTKHIKVNVIKKIEVVFVLLSKFLEPTIECKILSPGKPGIGKIKIQPIIDRPKPAKAIG